MTMMMGIAVITICSTIMSMITICGWGVDGASVRADLQSMKYVMLKTMSSKEHARCLARNRCYLKALRCPRRINKVPGKPSCFIDCSVKCEATCKKRKPNCSSYSSVCYESRFVGGDGVMFYFHGKSDESVCLLSDTNLHVNSHLIGVRDLTWVQALGIMFDNHSLGVGAERIGTWTSDDHLVFTYDGQAVDLTVGAGTKWISDMGEVEILRTSETNTVQVTIDGGLMMVTLEAVPVTREEGQVHHYELPEDNCFAHLNVQFDRFRSLSSNVDGVLGQTYRLDFKNPVKVGVPMPIMAGESKFRVSSLFSTDCLATRFHQDVEEPSTILSNGGRGTTSSTNGRIVCRR